MIHAGWFRNYDTTAAADKQASLTPKHLTYSFNERRSMVWSLLIANVQCWCLVRLSSQLIKHLSHANENWVASPPYNQRILRILGYLRDSIYSRRNSNHEFMYLDMFGLDIRRIAHRNLVHDMERIDSCCRPIRSRLDGRTGSWFRKTHTVVGHIIVSRSCRTRCKLLTPHHGRVTSALGEDANNQIDEQSQRSKSWIVSKQGRPCASILANSIRPISHANH